MLRHQRIVIKNYNIQWHRKMYFINRNFDIKRLSFQPMYFFCLESHSTLLCKIIVNNTQVQVQYTSTQVQLTIKTCVQFFSNVYFF